jgi:hypothetical protein
MRKALSLFILFISAISFSCKGNIDSNKNEDTATTDSLKTLYEGKIVKSTTGQWYLIKDGLRWRTNSIEATDNYLKKNPSKSSSIKENVSIEALHVFPEAGELLPGVVFKKDEE